MSISCHPSILKPRHEIDPCLYEINSISAVRLFRLPSFDDELNTGCLLFLIIQIDSGAAMLSPVKVKGTFSFKQGTQLFFPQNGESQRRGQSTQRSV